RLGGVEIVRRFQPGLPSIECHATQINQIWMALLINAAQAAAGTGTIEVCTSAEPAGWVTVTISDSGPGIAPQLLADVFEPFFTPRKPGEASGRGLTAARDVAARHGGRIEVSSERGHGATFRVILPVRAAAVQNAVPAQAPPPAAGAPS